MKFKPELKQKPHCCGEEMSYIEDPGLVSQDIIKDQMWICKSCGYSVRLVEEQLDEEVLEDYVLNYFSED